MDSFIAWFKQNGGYWSDNLELKQDDTWGVHLVAKKEIALEISKDADTKPLELVRCPSCLIITKDLAVNAIILTFTSISQSSNEQLKKNLESWSERQLITFYLFLHSFPTAIIPQTYMKHGTYVSLLPKSNEIPVPVLWTEPERELAKGSNLAHAAEKVLELWKKEWEGILGSFNGIEGLEEVLKSLQGTGDIPQEYILSNAWLMSRSFPSSLISPTSTHSINPSHIQPKPEHPASTSLHPNGTGEGELSYPILLPGIDLFNHKQGTPVTWTSHSPSSSSPLERSGNAVGFGVRSTISKGQQIFNNYGPKGNEELCLGYGFMESGNVYTNVAIKLGSSASLPPDVLEDLSEKGLSWEEVHYLKREDQGIPLNLLRTIAICQYGDHFPDGLQWARWLKELEEGGDEEKREMVEMGLDFVEVILDMLQSKINTNQAYLERDEEYAQREENKGKLREEVVRMAAYYLKEQIEILQIHKGKIEQQREHAIREVERIDQA